MPLGAADRQIPDHPSKFFVFPLGQAMNIEKVFFSVSSSTSIIIIYYYVGCFNDLLTEASAAWLFVKIPKKFTKFVQDGYLHVPILIGTIQNFHKRVSISLLVFSFFNETSLPDVSDKVSQADISMM